MRVLGKALAAAWAAAVAALSGLSAALDGHGLAGVTAQQWTSIVLAAVLAGGGVYGLSSSAKLTTPKDQG